MFLQCDRMAKENGIPSLIVQFHVVPLFVAPINAKGPDGNESVDLSWAWVFNTARYHHLERFKLSLRKTISLEHYANLGPFL